MPGVIRVDSAEPLSQGIAVSGSSSYGFTGAALGQGDSHHRGAVRLAGAYSVSGNLALALRFDGRYDKHKLASGSDDGWVGDPRLFLRYRRTVGRQLSAGVQLGVWAPGSSAPSVEFSAISAEAVFSLSWQAVDSPLVVSANAGYRLDRSAASVSQAERLSLSDRMSLGVSDYNAALFAVGASYDVGPIEALAEWSLDLLHGSGAPGFASSPMRVAAGARHQLDNGWYLFGTSEVRVSKVRESEVASLLLPFDPRVSVLAGLQFHFGGAKKAPKAPTLIAGDGPIKQVPPELSTLGSISGHITSDGAAVSNISVLVIDSQGNEVTLETDGDGAFSSDSVQQGDATIFVRAEGYEESETSTLILSEQTHVELKLDRTLPPGQLRGRLRSYRGKGLSGRLTVSPGDQSVDADADGNFELDLPPGDYEIKITVSKYKAQTRKIHIDENGVTIMNVDLRRGDRSRGR